MIERKPSTIVSATKAESKKEKSRIHARDGAAIKDVDIVTITAIEDADVVMVDVP